MLKYVSWILIACLLAWTWKLTYNEPKVAIEVHATIQREVADTIRAYIKENRPTVGEVKFLKLYTETINPTRIRAIFKYSFTDAMGDGEDTEQMFEGDAILNKDAKTATADESVWTLDEVNADNKTVVFKKGIEIHPGEGGLHEPDAEPSASPAPARPSGPSSPDEQHG